MAVIGLGVFPKTGYHFGHGDVVQTEAGHVAPTSEPYADQTVIFSLGSLRVPEAKVVVFPVDRNDRLAGRFVLAILGVGISQTWHSEPPIRGTKPYVRFCKGIQGRS